MSLTNSRGRLYDRKLKPLPPRQSSGLKYRIETLVGITGVRMAKYRDSWSTVWWAPFKIIWRPHLLSVLVFEVCLLRVHYIPYAADVTYNPTFTGYVIRFQHWYQRHQRRLPWDTTPDRLRLESIRHRRRVRHTNRTYISSYHHSLSLYLCRSHTHQVAVVIGELIGRYANEWIMNNGIKRNNGVFEAEVRLW